MIPNDKELLELFQLLVIAFDGKISESETNRLNSLLIENPEMRKYYWDFVVTYEGLVDLDGVAICELPGQGIDCTEGGFDENVWRALAEEERTAMSVEVEKPVAEPVEVTRGITKIEKQLPSKLSIYTAILSTAAMLLLLLYVWIVPAEPPIVASLGYTVDAVWGQSTEEKVMGEELRAGEYYLEKGLAQVLFQNGAKAILEGPADFELSSTSAMELISGKVVANVNREAAGFTVKTPSTKVLDLGTEFGVDVDLAGDSDIHVFDGEVVLYPENNGKKIPLLKGKAKSITTSGKQKDVELNKYAFVRQDEFNSNVKAQQGDSYHRWLAYSYQLRRDPSLVAYYTFEKNDQSPDILRNKASLTEDKLDGDLYSAIDGKLPSWTTGRWPRKTALNFDRSQRQVVVVPSDPALHITGPITITAWVRCLEKNDGGHIMSSREPQGRCNYQIGIMSPAVENWRDRIHFARKEGIDDIKRQVYSRKIDIGNDSDGWVFVAVTHDNQEVRFYYDGHLSGVEELQYRPELVQSDMVIGADDISGDPSRFSGDIGEMTMFKRVLSEDEILEMYEAGKP